MGRPGVSPSVWYNFRMTHHGRRPLLRVFTPVLALLLLAGCPPSTVVPATLEPQVDRHLTFAQVKESPESYRGRLIVLGGEVLSARRLKEGTRIEVLQLPLGSYEAPNRDRTASE